MTIGIPEWYYGHAAEYHKNWESQRKLAEMNKMNEEKPKGRHPDYKGEGVAVWIEKDKNGKPYLSGVVMNSLRFKAFKNEPPESKQQDIRDAFL